MSELTGFRNTNHQFFASDGHSPLTPQQQKSCRNLEYYPENPQLRFEVALEEFPDQEKEPTEIITGTSDSNVQIRWGRFNFNVEGQDVSLTVFQGMDAEEFLLPFADATSGSETYGAGRYLEPVSMHYGRYLIDFNHAYNPSCAYNLNWYCPSPSPGNRLKAPILAGEKLFPDDEGR